VEGKSHWSNRLVRKLIEPHQIEKVNREWESVERARQEDREKTNSHSAWCREWDRFLFKMLTWSGRRAGSRRCWWRFFFVVFSRSIHALCPPALVASIDLDFIFRFPVQFQFQRCQVVVGWLGSRDQSRSRGRCDADELNAEEHEDGDTNAE